MAEVDLRFYGRFVFAEPRRDEGPGYVDVLAIDMQFNRDLQAGKHHFLMSAPRNRVSAPGTRQPDFKVLAADTPNRAEHSVWDLSGQDIWTDLDSGFTWADKSTIADLRDLTSNDARFDQRVLDLSVGSTPVDAKLRLSAGAGRAKQLEPETFDLVALKAREGTPTIANRPLANLVEVKVDLPDEKPMLVLKMRPRGGGAVSSVAITARRDEPTVVSFTNLCSSPHTQYDEEFAGLYEVLENPPLARERLIPRERPTEGAEGNCNLLAYILYLLGH